MSKDGPKRMARQIKRLARAAAEVEHREDAQAREIVRSQAAARIQELLAPDDPVQPPPRTP